MNKPNGFSLVEMLIAMSIIAVLAVVSGPKIFSYLSQGEASVLNDAELKMKRAQKYQAVRDKSFSDCREWADMAGIKENDSGIQVEQDPSSGYCILSYQEAEKELDGGFPTAPIQLALDFFTPQSLHQNVTYPSGLGNVNTANDCAQICLDNSACIAFTHSIVLKTCWAFTSGTGTYSEKAQVGDGLGYRKL